MRHIFGGPIFFKQLNYIYSTDRPIDTVGWDALLPSVKLSEKSTVPDSKTKPNTTIAPKDNRKRRQQISVVDTATLTQRTILL